MAEQRVHSLLDALDGRTRSLLERLAHEREARRHAEAVQAELAQRLGELERRLAESEATCRELKEECRELKEECRELDEQNGELEAHNRHLHERLASGEPAAGGFRPGRRSQGLSALIDRRPAPQQGDAAAPESPDKSGSYHADKPTQAPTEVPVGARLVGRSAQAADATGDTPAPESPDKSGSYNVNVAKPTKEAPSPQALLGEWYQRYPAAFFKGHTRPLMVGIHELLASREPWPEKLVRRALACYVNLPRYLKAMREDAERIDLDGQPAGKVDAQAADYAHRKLDRLQGEKRAGQARPSPSRHPQGRGKPAKAGGPGGQERGKPSAQKGQGDSAGQAARKPAFERTEPAAPATLEEKLSALMAKHNAR